MAKSELKEKILVILEKFEKTRNDDVELMLMIWYNYHRKDLFQDGTGWSVNLDKIRRLPREDHIKRIRAIIQNDEKLYLPTDPEVRKKRQISEEEWREYVTKNK